MPHVVTTDLASLQGSSSLTALNNNIHLLRDEFEKVLYKDGREELTDDLDANSQRIYNLPDGILPSEPMTMNQLDLLLADPGTLVGVETGLRIEADEDLQDQIDLKYDITGGDIFGNVTLSAAGPTYLEHYNSLAPSGSKFWRTSVINNGTWILGKANDAYTVETAMLTISPAGALTIGSVALGGADGATLVGMTMAGTGAVVRDIRAKFRELPVSITDFKLDADPDWTLAINRALATGKNVYLPPLVGGYAISDMVSFHADGQQIFGDGVKKSYFICSGGFNLAATGVFYIPTTASENHAGFHNVGIVMGQPDTAVRASMIAYPPVIYAPGVTRLFIGNIRISGAQKAMVLTGNCGGLVGWNWEIGSVSAVAAVEFDGALDTVSVQAMQFWPWGLGTANQLSVYQDGQTIGLKCGRVDGLAIGLLRTFCSRFVFPLTGDPGFGTVSALQLDGRRGRWEQAGGHWVVGAMYATTDLADDFFVSCSGGSFSCGSWWGLQSAASGTAALFQATGTGHLKVRGGTLFDCPATAPYAAVTTTGAFLDYSHNTHLAAAGTDHARTLGFVRQVLGRLTCIGNTFADKGTGTGDAITCATDEWNLIGPNAMVGWTIALPGTHVNGIYFTANGIVTTT